MEPKLTINSDAIITAYKELSDSDFKLVILAAAKYAKYKRVSPKFTPDKYPNAYNYFVDNILPLQEGVAPRSSHLDTEKQEGLFKMIQTTTLFNDDERKVLLDMYRQWLNRNRSELIYTNNMCMNNTGVSDEVFNELKRYLKSFDCLTWDTREVEYDGRTSNRCFYMFNEINLYKLLKEYED